MDWAKFAEMSDSTIRAFKKSDLGEVIGIMQSFFDSEKFTIWHLFQEEKRKIIQEITQVSLQNVENDFREIYFGNYQLMSSMQQSGIQLPEAYLTAVKYILNLDLHQFFSREKLQVRELKRLLGELDKWNVVLDNEASFNLAASERIFQDISHLEITPESLAQIQLLNDMLEVLNGRNLTIDVWKSQNQYFSLLKKFKSNELEYPTLEWLNGFTRLGNLLKVRG